MLVRNVLKKSLWSTALYAVFLTVGVTSSAFADHNKHILQAVVAERSVETQKRDIYRHPVETLSFFQIEPGMTVAEALPGGGWYTRILANYLGTDGAIYGVNYTDSMWPRFGFFSEQAIKDQIASNAAFPSKVAEFTDNGVAAKGFTFDTVPESLHGTVDRMLFIRALHNLNRFESEAGTLSEALLATHKMLKPGGMVGVVQHQIPESAPEEGASGSRGYLKQSAVEAMFKAAGFELVATSDINKNPKDTPANNEVVWRLPPALSGAKDDEEKKNAMLAIGESNRMTLLFKKI